ncbi:MAG: hypothetical protein WCE51_16120 [Chthoniobacterales bacterium]|jgi:hypothetical protein
MNPRKTCSGNVAGGEKCRRLPQKVGSLRQEKYLPPLAAQAPNQKQPASSQLARTRKLVTAALRVWELKQGFHE